MITTLKAPSHVVVDVLLPGYDDFRPTIVYVNHITHIEPLKPTEGRPEKCVYIHLVSGVRLIALGEVG